MLHPRSASARTLAGRPQPAALWPRPLYRLEPPSGPRCVWPRRASEYGRGPCCRWRPMNPPPSNQHPPEPPAPAILHGGYPASRSPTAPGRDRRHPGRPRPDRGPRARRVCRGQFSRTAAAGRTLTPAKSAFVFWSAGPGQACPAGHARARQKMAVVTAAVVAGVRGGHRPVVNSDQRRQAYEEQDRFWQDLVGNDLSNALCHENKLIRIYPRKRKRT